MITLAHPWFLALLPLPLLVRWVVPAHREPRQGVIVPFLQRLADESGQQSAEGAVVLRGAWLRVASVTVAWTCVILALARPQVGVWALLLPLAVIDDVRRGEQSWPVLFKHWFAGAVVCANAELIRNSDANAVAATREIVIMGSTSG